MVLDQKAKMKSHAMNETVVFWKWTSATNLALITATAVYHWPADSNAAATPAKVFDRHATLGPTTQIINYRVSPDQKWCFWPCDRSCESG